MNLDRFQAITGRYSRLSIAVVGDFCLDRGFEMETGPASDPTFHRVANSRHEAGGAGTLVNHLAALGIGTILPVGVVGDDGDALDLRRALAAKPGVRLDHFLHAAELRTAVGLRLRELAHGTTPHEFARIEFQPDPTLPPALDERITNSVIQLSKRVNAMILCRRTRQPETGVVTPRLAEAVRIIAKIEPRLPIIAEGGGELRDLAPLGLSLTGTQLAQLAGLPPDAAPEALKTAAVMLAQTHRRPVFVRLPDHGLIGATPKEGAAFLPAPPVSGPTDDAGAHCALTASVTPALTMGATLMELLVLAQAAIGLVIHQLGTTGAPALAQLDEGFNQPAPRTPENPPATTPPH